MNTQINTLPFDQLFAILEITTKNREIQTVARLSQTCKALYRAIAYWRKNTIPASTFRNLCINDRFIDIWVMNEAQRKWDHRERRERRQDKELRNYGDYQNMKAIVTMDLTYIVRYSNSIGYYLELARALCSKFGYSEAFVKFLSDMIQDGRINGRIYDIKSEYAVNIIKEEIKDLSLKSVPENGQAQIALEKLNAHVASLKFEKNTEINWNVIALFAILLVLSYVYYLYPLILFGIPFGLM